MVPLPPLDSPKPSFKPRRPSVARQNARGSQGRSVLQGYILDGSGAFRSANLTPCTVWPRTVMRGNSRKVNSGHNSVPKSARRTEPSPPYPRFAAHLRCVSAKEGKGSQEGQGNLGVPAPFAPVGGHRHPRAAEGGHCARHVMANIPRPGRASLASTGFAAVSAEPRTLC